MCQTNNSENPLTSRRTDGGQKNRLNYRTNFILFSLLRNRAACPDDDGDTGEDNGAVENGEDDDLDRDSVDAGQFVVVPVEVLVAVALAHNGQRRATKPE